jgi:hypothetical protein
MRTARVIYYLAAIVFHYFSLFTYAGNYWHGGTPFEIVALETTAILISWNAIKIALKVRPLEKIVVVLFGMFPMFYAMFSIAWTLNIVVELVFGLRLFGR